MLRPLIMTKKWWILAAVACGTFMATLDSSIVNIALPTLTREFSASLYKVKWVVIIYLLTITCALLPFGRLSDLWGRKRVFQWGFIVFIVGSALCSFGGSLNWLIGARVLQGLGASMLMANGPAIITQSFPSTERGGALGTLSMVVSAGLISGPSLGGILISTFGWKSIFLINIPIGCTGAYLVHYFLRGDTGSTHRASFDWMGAILQSAILVFLMIIFDPPSISIAGAAGDKISRWPLSVITALLVWVFIYVESRAQAPLLDLSLLKIKVFWTSNVASLLTFIAFSTVTILMPFYLEKVMGFPTHLAGIFMSTIPLTILIVAPISGRMSDRMGSRGLSSAGSLIGGISLLAMSGFFGEGLKADTSHLMIVLGLCAIGLAIGLFQSPNNNAIMGSVPLNKLGVASALLATIRNLGLVIGTGLASGVFTWRMTVTDGDFVRSLHFTVMIAGVVSLFAMVACLAKKRSRNFLS
jgi:EmrB/QacA subfamily drug resistance transporter